MLGASPDLAHCPGPSWGKSGKQDTAGAEHTGVTAGPSCILFPFPFHACGRAPLPAEVSSGYSLLCFPCSCHALPVSL